MKKSWFILCGLASLTGCAPGPDGQPMIDARILTPAIGPFVVDPQGGPPPLPPEGMPPHPDNRMPPPPGGFQPGSPKAEFGTAAYIVADGERIDGGTYSSGRNDENVIRAQGDTSATLNGVTIVKNTGRASSNEGSSFYGLNAAVLVKDHANLDINGGRIVANAEGANGVFAYGNAIIHIRNTQVQVSGGNAGGIEVAGGGVLYADNLNVHTTVKAAIRSDRGGGQLFVNGGEYTTQGSMGAPAIYSTADIHVNNANLTANDSEAVVIEGFNSVTLNNSHLTGHMRDPQGRDGDDVVRNVMLYQSMSGDAQDGMSKFTMNGGDLTARSGDMFYVTNTDSVVNLHNVAVTLAPNSLLLRVSGNHHQNGWGAQGHNGGICGFNLTHQTITGDILVDTISQLNLSMTASSHYTGAINRQGMAAQSLSVTMDDSSTWTLTDNSYISEFHGNLHRVEFNGHTLYIGGKPVTHA